MIKSFLLPLFCCLSVNLCAQLFRDDVQVILDQQQVSTLRFADLDGDDDLDMVGSRFGYNGSYLTFFNEDGNGNYAPPIPYGDTTWWGNPDISINFELGDMDNDGDIDLVPGNIGLAEHPFWPNDGTGTFATSSQVHYQDDIWDHHYFHLADLDNDGHLDIVTYRANVREIRINRNLGNGESFEHLLLYDAFDDFSPEYVSDFILLDYDLDGDLDLGFVSRDPLTDDEFFPDHLYFTLYEQTCNLCFTQKSRFIVDEAAKYFGEGKVRAADLDSDLYPDLVIEYAKDDEPDHTRTYTRTFGNNSGDGAFTLRGHYNDIFSPVIGDYDQDGDQDIFWGVDPDSAYHSGSAAHYYWQENLGNFNFQPHLIDETASGRGTFLQDINQDDHLDFLTLDGQYSGTITARLGLSSLDFAPYRVLNINMRSIKTITTHDWDNDGDLDLFYFGDGFGEDTQPDGIYRQNQLADGTFAYPELVYRTSQEGTDKTFVDLDNNGKIDAVGFEQVIGPGSNRILVYTLQQTNGTWSDGIVIGPDLEIDPAAFLIADWDNDGDQDLMTKNYDDAFYLLSNELASGGTFTVVDLPDLDQELPSYVREWYLPADFNQDGQQDILSTINDELFWATGQAASLAFSAWTPIATAPFDRLYQSHIADWDADGDQDLLIQGSIPDQGVVLAVLYFDQEEQVFSPPFLLEHNGYVSSQAVVVDLNQDGFPDYASGLGYHINQLNGRLLSAAFVPEPQRSDTYLPNLPGTFLSNLILTDLHGNDQPKIVSGYREIVAYDPSFLSTSTLSGFVRWDTTAQCSSDTILPPLENWRISLESPTHELLATTNIGGHYGSLLPTPEDYLVQVIPPSGYWAACPIDTTLEVVDNESTYQVDFAAEALVECPLVVIEMSSTTISQCFGSAVSIGYYNAGTAPAEDATITLQHDPRLLPVGSNIPWTSGTDTTLVFELGTVAVGLRSQLSIQFEPECEALELGEEVCFEASVTPNELCEDMLLEWDGANLEADVICQADGTAYRITNTGTGGMSAPVDYQVSIVNDDIILYLDGTVILEPGASDTIPLPPMDDYWYLQLPQTPGHPYPTPVGLFAEDCSITDPLHTPQVLPTGTGDPFRVVLCREVIGPYDPNDKSALPLGLTDAHYIERSQPLDYTIQFQNVGSDRARNVILIDTLSAHLDIGTFAPVGASHDYEWAITDQRILHVTFPEINLPDSTSNEVGSHGFFSFRMRPAATTPFETDVLNFADIYFDFNPPIRTGTTRHRIRKPQRSAAVYLEICTGTTWQEQLITQDTILTETLVFAAYDSTTFYHFTALPSPVIEQFFVLDEPGYWAGNYIASDTIIPQLLQTQYGCDSLVLNHVSLLTATSELEERLRVKLYPNPAADQTLLSWATGERALRTRIIDARGREVRSSPTIGATSSLSLSTRELPSGNYQVLVYFTEGVIRRKLQVVR